MFDLSALWIAAYYRIPLLVLMFNNRAYQNDWTHQEQVAKHRGTPVENAVLRAADVVMSEGRPALVDVVCQPK